MKKILLVAAALSACGTSAFAGAFTAGNLVVSQVGDGSTALVNTGGPLALLEFSTAGVLQQTITISSTVSSGLQLSGSASSEGALSRSQDGTKLTIAGYNPPFTGSGSIGSRTDPQAPRAYVEVNASGVVSSPVAVAAYGSNNIRSAVETDSGVYLAGGTSGTIYRAGGINTTIQSTNTNTRVVNIQNGNLYYSTGSGTTGIYGFTGTPTASTSAISIITGVTGQGSNPYDFAFSPDGLTAYVADGSVGVQKFTMSGGLWSLAYNITTATTGLTGLAVDFSGADYKVYAVNPTTLYSFTDLGLAGAMASVATTNGTTYAFRGLEFSAVPEPQEYGIALAALLVALIVVRRRRMATAA